MNFTRALLSATESFSAVTRTRSKSHTTPNMGCVRFSRKQRSVSPTLIDAILSTNKSFLVVTRARSKSHTAPNRCVSRFSTNIRSVSSTLTETLLSTTASFSAGTRARSKSHTTPNTGCVAILYKYAISELSPHGCTFDHRVFLCSDSCLS